MQTRPIGVIDSGLGGLTVLKEIKELLPGEQLLYVGDSKNAPFGPRHAQEIYTLANKLISFLLQRKVKMIVIACNTITVSCIDRLRAQYPDIPIIGAVPVVKTAVAVTKNKRIGILSTTQTAHSDYQQKLIAKYATDFTVFNHGTDTLVPLIEQGKLYSPEMQTALHKALSRFMTEDIDTLALGCTHFPYLKEQMQELLGTQVNILDSGAAIARHVRRVLESNELLQDATNAQTTFYTTGKKEQMEEVLKILFATQEKAERIAL